MLKAIILAAGKGTRMKSDKPKVVHEVLGKPMVYYSIEAAKNAGCEKVCVIVGYKAEEVEHSIYATYESLGLADEMNNRVSYALQKEQLGTGHAVKCASDFIGNDGDVVVLCGDTASYCRHIGKCHQKTQDRRQWCNCHISCIGRSIWIWKDYKG